MVTHSVNRSSVPFTAIGAGHGIEQENHSLKVLGGIKGLTNKQHSLDEYFLTAGQISDILDDFADHFNLRDHQELTEHYQLTASKNVRISKNVNKLLTTLCNRGVSFNNTTFLYNILTNKVMPPESADKFLEAREIGIQLYNTFIDERIVGNKSVWDTMSKYKLLTFISLNIQIAMKINQELVKNKEEHILMSWFSLASRSKPEIDLSFYLGEYALSVVPRSLFSADSVMYQDKDKSVVVLNSDSIRRNGNGKPHRHQEIKVKYVP